LADACKPFSAQMISHKDYNCNEMGECYLSYRKRMKREKEEYEANRPVKMSTEEWLKGYVEFSEIYASGLFMREGETPEQLKARFKSQQAGGVGDVE